MSVSGLTSAAPLFAEADMLTRIAERSRTRDGLIAAEKAASSAGEASEPSSVRSHDDLIDISQAGREAFAAYRNMAAPSANSPHEARMIATTRHGAAIMLEARSQRSAVFSLGKFGERGGEGNVGFVLSGASGKADDLLYTLTVTTARGETQTYNLTGNTRLREDDAGNIRMEEADADTLNGTDGQDILINLKAGGMIDGRGGDDIIFNLAENARADGGDGNDVITSLGNGAALFGGAGDDAIAVLYDTLHPFKEDRRRTSNGFTEVIGRGRNQQQVTVDGGEGDDGILARADLYKARISGGAGMDVIELGDITDTVVDGGDGSDMISLNTMLKDSVVQGGDGHDAIRVNGEAEGGIFGGAGDDDIIVRGEKIKNLRVNGGSGDDWIDISVGSGDGMRGATVLGGAGDDLLWIKGNVNASEIDGGSGDDFMLMQGTATNSAVRGGSGDDRLILDQAERCTVEGGDGNDSIQVNKAVNTGLYGGDGNDVIQVGIFEENPLPAADYPGVIDGGRGNDVIAVEEFVSGDLRSAQGEDAVVIGGEVRSWPATFEDRPTGLETNAAGIRAYKRATVTRPSPVSRFMGAA